MSTITKNKKPMDSIAQAVKTVATKTQQIKDNKAVQDTNTNDFRSNVLPPSPTSTVQDTMAGLPSNVVLTGTTSTQPTGVALSDYLKGKGIDVTYDAKTGAVTANGKPVDTSGMSLYNSSYYADPGKLDAIAASVVPAVDPQKAQIDSLIAMLQSLANQPLPSVPTLSYQDATAQAANELNPQYAQAKTDMIGDTNIDLEKRGIFNSPLASGIVTDKSGRLEASRLSEVGKMANTLVSASKEDAARQQQILLQERSQRASTLGSLLSTLSNKSLSEAELTGVYQGIKTIAAQQMENDKIFKDSQIELQKGEMMGEYEGAPTLDAVKVKMDEAANAITAALQRTQTFGKVSDAADAKILGVKVGTPTLAAVEAAKDRATQIKLKQMEIGAQMAAARMSHSAGQSSDNFNQAMAIWQQTGKAPNSATLQKYGIKAGQEWKLTPEETIKKMQTDAALQQAKDVETQKSYLPSIQSDYGVNTVTAAAIWGIWENPNRASAEEDYKSSLKLMQTQGINTDKVWKAIESRWPLKKGQNTTDKVSNAIDSLGWDWDNMKLGGY